MIGVKKNVVVFFGLFLVGMLFVPTGIPFMDPIPEAEAFTAAEEECIASIGGTNSIIPYYQVYVCDDENSFNATVYMGQQIKIGSEAAFIPSATYNATGTYSWYNYYATQYGASHPNAVIGTITITNPPDVGVEFQDFTYTINPDDNNRLHTNFDLKNNLSTDVRIYTYFHATDNAGNVLGNWLYTGNGDGAFNIPAGATLGVSFSAPCCLPYDTGVQVTPYIIQVISNHNSPYSVPSGTPLIDVNVYPETAGAPSGTVTITSPVNIQAFESYTTNPNPTGGDCTQIGTWDAATLTCTLTADITVTSNAGAIKLGQALYSGYTGSTAGITIDGAGHTITGTGGGQMSDAGIYFYKTHQVVVKNLVIENFKVGINSHQTNGVTITGNTIKDSHYGVYVYQTGTCPNCGSGVAITNNTVENSGSYQGSSSILVQNFEGDGTCNTSIPYFHPEYAAGPPGNNPTPVTVKGNTITDGGGWGITLDAAGACIDSNTVTGKQSAIHISGPGYSNAQNNNNIISNNVVTSSTNDGIDVVGSGNTIDSNTVSNSQYYSGFSFDSRSQNNIITNNVANNNGQYGFEFADGSNVASHTFTGNTASGNGIADIEGISTLTPTCFASSGYQILAPGIQVQSPPGSGNMVTLTVQHVMFSGKLQSNADGTCNLSNSLGLEGKSVTLTAVKDGVTKTANIYGYNNVPVTTSVTDDGVGGFFQHLIQFTNSTDGGTWTYTKTFAGDNSTAGTSSTGTINVPAPPPPTSNVDLTLTNSDITPYPEGTHFVLQLVLVWEQAHGYLVVLQIVAQVLQRM